MCVCVCVYMCVYVCVLISHVAVRIPVQQTDAEMLSHTREQMLQLGVKQGSNKSQQPDKQGTSGTKQAQYIVIHVSAYYV